MKIAHFNTFPYGGAATAGRRIHGQLNDLQLDSQFYYSICDRELQDADKLNPVKFVDPPMKTVLGLFDKRLQKNRKRRIHRQFDQHLQNRLPGAETFSMAELPDSTCLDWDSIQADIVHLHWIAYLADYPSFFESIPGDIPIVWTLHDMNPLTGGCHYSNGCEQFLSGCGNCPQINAPGPTDVSLDGFKAKQKAFAHKRLHIVTPSQWLNRLAKQSPVFPNQTSFHVIRLGFDLKKFSPIEKSSAKRKLGLNEDSVFIAFGADDIRNHRKGFHHLVNCLPAVKTESQLECLVFGSGKFEQAAGLPTLHQFGFVDSLEQQSLIYSAADIVIVPSREDNSPQVGLEAMACGTPVIGFNAGGIAEYVREGITGRLARIGDEPHLAAKISQLVDDPDSRKFMSARARLMMESEYELETQTQKYVSLYRDILAVNRRDAA